MRRWWLAAGLIVLVALGLALSSLLPAVLNPPVVPATRPGTGAAPSSAANVVTPAVASAAAGVTAGPPATAGRTPPLDVLLQAEPLVSSSTAWVHDLIAEKDGVWAASSGGLVRWKGDGTSKVFNAGDGLPFSHTRALLTLSDGSFWAAGDYVAVHITPAGDGLGQIQKYSDAEGLDLGQNPLLMLDGDGSIWLASQYTSQPVYRFDGTLWRPPALPVDDPALRNLAAEITALLRARDGALWVGLNQGGILRFDGSAWTLFGAQQGVPGTSIAHLLEDHAGVMWAAAGDAGLLRFEPAAGRWSHVELQRPDAPVDWIAELADGSLWASGDNFIARSTDGGGHWVPRATPEDGLDHPTAVVEDGAGRIWVATSNGVGESENGQWRLRRRSGEPGASAFGGLVGAPDGRLWAVQEYGGTPSAIDPASGQAGLPAWWPQDNPAVTALAFVGDATWAGTWDGLLRLQGASQGRLMQADGLPDDRVSALLATPRSLWIGTQSGLAGYSLQSQQITGTVEALAGHAVDALLVAPDGALWVGSHWGEHGASSAVERFAGAEHQVWPNDQAPLNGPGNSVHALAADDEGGVWVALNGGVQRWDGQRWVGWSAGQGAPQEDVFALLSHDGAMWVAGREKSIYRWSSQDGWQGIHPTGLTGTVRSMHVTGDGALWLATDDGLLRYFP